MNPALQFFAQEEARDALKSRRVKVTLTPEQYERAMQLAQARNRKESKYGGMTYGEVRGSLEAHIIGIVPEMAVCVAGGGAIDARIFESHGDEGIDAVLPVLGKCGVKTTTYSDDPYLRVEMEHFRSDIDTYVLCYYQPKQSLRDVWIIGWAAKTEVAKGQQRRFVTGGPMNYVLYEHQLHQW